MDIIRVKNSIIIYNLLNKYKVKLTPFYTLALWPRPIYICITANISK